MNKLKSTIPLAGTGVIAGGGYAAKTFLGLEPGTWAWVWPSLVAVAFLFLAVLALLWGGKRWLLPLLAGFVTQACGTLVYQLTDHFESPWTTLKYTGAVVGSILLGMGIYWLVSTLRARWLERHMIDGLGEDSGVDPEKLQGIRNNMLEALHLLKRAGQGRNAIYELPWFLVVGRPSVGKTVAIKESGLTLPVKKDWVKGVGGTYTCDFFFTNDLIFMDTPGEWVRDGASDTAKTYWESLLKLLKKFRGRRPLDGLIVVVSVEDLLGADLDPEDQVSLEDQAANIREIIDLLHEQLNFRFPVYLIVSKSDLVEGFTDFFWSIPAKRRHETLGWSNPNPNDHRVDRMIRTGFGKILNRLETYRLEMLARLGKRTRNRRLFLFTEEFKQLLGPLTKFTDILFHRDPSTQTPIFRGFYFTSGMQGEGSPISRALRTLSHDLNLPRKKASAASEDEGKRSFFLLELFREVLVGDEGLVGRTAVHWWKRRRKTMLGAFLPAALAMTILLFSGLSLLTNRSLYRSIREETPVIRQTLATLTHAPLNADSLTLRLEETDKLRQLHRKLTSINPFRRLGMRRAAELEKELFKLYKAEFSAAVLRPVLKMAQTATSTGLCADRVEIFHSVVWMRLANRHDSSKGNMAGFDLLWPDLEPDESMVLRKELLQQFRHLVKHDPDGSVGSLLTGFSMASAARSIQEDSQCDMAGASSALGSFSLFLKTCNDPRNDGELLECYRMLHKVVSWDDVDTKRYLANIQGLQESLGTMRGEESEADDALATLETMKLGEEETSQCVEQFGDILPILGQFAIREDYLQDCKIAVNAAGSGQEKIQARSAVIASQDEELKPIAEGLRKTLENYSGTCFLTISQPPFSMVKLDFNTVETVSFLYRREACKRDLSKAVATKRPTRPQRRSSGASSSTALPRTTTSRPRTRPASSAKAPEPAGLFSKRCNSAGRTYSPVGWEGRTGEWQAAFLAAEDPQLTPERQRRERERVESEIRRYGSNYSAAWLKCLGTMQLKEPADIPTWLSDVSADSDFISIFDKAIEQLNEVSALAVEPPLNAVQSGLKNMEEIRKFKDEKWEEYLSLVSNVGNDLQNVAGDPGRFLEYRRSYNSTDRENSLVKLEEWVRKNVNALAGGRLVTLLSRPHQSAGKFVSSETLIKGQWTQLVQLFTGELADTFPFSSDSDNGEKELAGLEPLAGMFGFQSGLVHKIQLEELGPDAKAWVEQARKLASIMITKDEDSPRKLRLNISALPPEAAPEPKELQKNYQIVRTILSLDPVQAQELLWNDEDENPPALLKVDLFGEDAAYQAKLVTWVAERKGRLLRMVKKNDWKDGEKLVIAEIKDLPWAPLRLLQAGARDGGGGQQMALRFEVPWGWGGQDKQGKFKKNGKFLLHFQVRSDDLPNLIQLLNNGMSPPPGSYTQ